MDFDNLVQKAKEHILTESVCPSCKGAKVNIESEPCSICNGYGVIQVNQGAQFEARLRGDIAKLRRWVRP